MARLKNNALNLEMVALLGVVLLFYGFFFHRVTNNLGSILIGFYAVMKLKENKKIFIHPWMISILLISLVPFISDIILEGVNFHKHRGDLKLLLIVFPAFIFTLKPDQRMIVSFMKAFIIFMFLSSCYSLYHYVIEYDDMYLTYKESRVVKTLSYGDHIRISWATVVSCIFVLYLIFKKLVDNPFIFWVYIVFQIIFLHILGSKTGLISLYLTIGIFCIFGLSKISKSLAVGAITLIAIIPIVAYKTIPSFEQRVNFIKYDFEHYSKGAYREGLSDAIRYYSLLAGKDIIINHPWTGCGFSRLQEETNHWWRTKMPQISEENYFVPSSQIVIYWASGGIISLIIFLFHLVYPLFDIRLRTNMWFMMFYIPTALSFGYETHLEGQLSLFFYGFFLSFFWYLGVRDLDISI